MTLSHKEIQIQQACTKLAEILIAKNRDYGSAYLKRGDDGLIMRIEDKLHRIENLNDQPYIINFESKKDNWLDTAGYAILGYVSVE